LTLTEPRNPIGVGLQHNADDALSQELPRVEFVDDPMLHPCARPEPSVLRLEAANVLLKLPIANEGTEIDECQLLLRSLHPAHHRAWGDRLAEGDIVLVEGAADATIVFDLPPSPVMVSMRQSRVWKKIGSHIRHVAIDLERRSVEVLFGHSASYSTSKAVSDVRVEARMGP